jgi:hypothetical protein
MTPEGREEVGKQSAASGFPGNTYPLHENNCVANGGNHRGARALRVTLAQQNRPHVHSPPEAAPAEG